MRNDSDREPVAFETGDGETDTLKSNRPFEGKIPFEFVRHRDMKPEILPAWNRLKAFEDTYSIDMSLDEMAADSTVSCQRQFEIDCCSLADSGKRSSHPCFFC
jgi:hypothetical protein